MSVIFVVKEFFVDGERGALLFESRDDERERVRQIVLAMTKRLVEYNPALEQFAQVGEHGIATDQATPLDVTSDAGGKDE